MTTPTPRTESMHPADVADRAAKERYGMEDAGKPFLKWLKTYTSKTEFNVGDMAACWFYRERELAAANARLARLRELAKAILHADADERGDAEDALRAELEKNDGPRT